MSSMVEVEAPQPVDVWRKPHANVVPMWRLTAFFGLIVPVGAGFGFDFALRAITDRAWPIGLLTGLALVAFSASAIFLPPIRYRNWSFCLREQELVAKWGVLFLTQRYVARSRIQHVDITSGPISRHFGMVELSVFVGGSVGSAVTIPGLAPREAEALRDELLPRKAAPTPPPVLEPAPEPQAEREDGLPWDAPVDLEQRPATRNEGADGP